MLNKLYNVLCEDYGIETVEEIRNYGFSGGIGGFIYYYETENFFNEYSTEIIEGMEEIKNEFGDCFQFEYTKNNLVWYVLEMAVVMYHPIN